MTCSHKHIYICIYIYIYIDDIETSFFDTPPM